MTKALKKTAYVKVYEKKGAEIKRFRIFIIKYL